MKTFTDFTSNIFMMALLLTPSRLIWWCILYNVITEGKIRLIRYNVWNSLVALMCIFQFSVLPIKSNKNTLSSSSAFTPGFTLLCYSSLTCTVPVLFLTFMSLWSFQSYEYLRHSYKLLCWLKVLDHIIFWLLNALSNNRIRNMGLLQLFHINASSSNKVSRWLSTRDFQNALMLPHFKSLHKQLGNELNKFYWKKNASKKKK